MRSLLILSIAITCTGCYSFRSDSPLLSGRNRLARDKAAGFVEYEPFDQLDPDFASGDSPPGVGTNEPELNSVSLEADKQADQAERILDLIEQTDDALLRRILAEKLLERKPAEQTHIAGLSPEERLSAEKIALEQAESTSFGAQFAEVPRIDRVENAEQKLMQPQRAATETADNLQASAAPHEQTEPAAKDDAIVPANDSKADSPDASTTPVSTAATVDKAAAQFRQEPAKLDAPQAFDARTEIQAAVIESGSGAKALVQPVSLKQRLPADNVFPSNEFNSESWQDELKSTIASLESSLQDGALAKDEQATRQIYLRLLHLIGNNGQQATRSIQELDAVDQQFWYSQMQALTSLLDSSSGEATVSLHASPGAATEHAVVHLRQAIQRLSNEAELQVNNVALCREVLGYGQYEPFGKYEFPVDQDVLIYCELENFVTARVQSQDGKLFESEFKGRVAISNENQQVVHRHEYSNVRDTGRRPRRDFYMYFPMTIPKLPPGNYLLRLEVEDLKGNKVGTSRKPITVVIR